MDLYSPDCVVLHSMLGRKVFRKYSVQVRMKTDYINKVVNWICFIPLKRVFVGADVTFSPLFVYKIRKLFSFYLTDVFGN